MYTSTTIVKSQAQHTTHQSYIFFSSQAASCSDSIKGYNRIWSSYQLVSVRELFPFKRKMQYIAGDQNNQENKNTFYASGVQQGQEEVRASGRMLKDEIQNEFREFLINQDLETGFYYVLINFEKKFKQQNPQVDIKIMEKFELQEALFQIFQKQQSDNRMNNQNQYQHFNPNNNMNNQNQYQNFQPNNNMNNQGSEASGSSVNYEGVYWQDLCNYICARIYEVDSQYPQLKDFFNQYLSPEDMRLENFFQDEVQQLVRSCQWENYLNPEQQKFLDSKTFKENHVYYVCLGR
eukprot:TRINITY_DN6153_c1_g1_i1.p1 TRINITY_DN6153_c1_g1~~TRINITY_DN6153_c1_g1_i1.p1  ORF type:complete len:292 (-),score=1.84 TRINITY_DN6153_c1_g1_i1:503-1378(-)